MLLGVWELVGCCLRVRYLVGGVPETGGWIWVLVLVCRVMYDLICARVDCC